MKGYGSLYLCRSMCVKHGKGRDLSGGSKAGSGNRKWDPKEVYNPF